MTKRALIINIQNNEVEIGDCEAICIALRKAGFQAERKSLNEMGVEGSDNHFSKIPVEEYSVVGFMSSFSALMASRKNSRTVFENIVERAQPESLTLFVSDTTLPLDPNMWNTTEGHKFKKNVYALKPMKVIGSFSEGILDDESAMRRAHSVWLKKLHPNSEFIPVEWLSAHIDMVENKITSSLSKAESMVDEIYPSGVPEVKNFYYGIKKPKVAKRLREMGILDDERNAVFGTISQVLKGVRSFDTGSSKKRGPEYWAPIATRAEGIYIPYDPVKGDYQFTPRFIESHYLNPNGLIIDPLISDEIAAFTNPEIWREKLDEVSEKLNTIF